MAREKNYFQLGLWVLLVATLFVATLVFLGGRAWEGDHTEFVVRFPVTYSLPDEIKEGSAVYCGTTQVGKVTKKELRSISSNIGAPALWTYMTLEVRELVQLRSDCVIVARGLLLGGGGKLIIKDPGQKGEVFQQGQLIDGSPAGTFDDIIEAVNLEIDPRNPYGLLATLKTQLDPADAQSIIAKIHGSLDDINTLTRIIAVQADPEDRAALMGKLVAILENFHATTDQLRKQVSADQEGSLITKVDAALDTINRSLGEVSDLIVETKPSVKQTMASVQRTAEILETGIAGPIASELNLANTAGLLTQIHSAFDRLNQSLDDATVLTGKAKNLVVLNSHRFSQLMQNLTETSDHLKNAGKDLRRNPWRLFYRPSLDETKQLNIFDAAREFSGAAARLDDSATQLAALMESRDEAVASDDPDLIEIKERLKKTFDDYTRTEEALWNLLNTP